MNYQDFAELVHTNIHAIRLIKDYKPSKLEMDLNRMIAELFSSKCAECKEKTIELKYRPAEKEKGFLGKVFG